MLGDSVVLWNSVVYVLWENVVLLCSTYFRIPEYQNQGYYRRHISMSKENTDEFDFAKCICWKMAENGPKTFDQVVRNLSHRPRRKGILSKGQMSGLDVQAI